MLNQNNGIVGYKEIHNNFLLYYKILLLHKQGPLGMLDQSALG